MDSTRFYIDMPTCAIAPSQLLVDPSRFAPVPADWEVLLTDVRGSTKAVSEGRINTVNLVATGCIIAALNLAHRDGNDLPFFFGGDGATLLVPPSLAEPVASALALHRENTRAQFDLDLRVGRIKMADVYRAGHRIDLAKVDVSGGGLVLPVALGEGLQYVDRVVKREDADEIEASDDALLDLAGMECRWSNIRPPGDRQEVVCLIVSVRDTSRQGKLLAEVLGNLDDIYEPVAVRCPVSRRRLKFRSRLDRIADELRLKVGRLEIGRLLKTWLVTMLSRPWFAFHPSGRHYLDRLVQLANTLTIDGRLYTVIAGTPQQRAALDEQLRVLEARGDITYGLDVCSSSVMSCYVRDRRDQHIHFVDGQGGGYTRASIDLKRKLATLR